MKTLLIATANKGKISDFRNFLTPKGIEVVSLLDINPNIDIVEDKDTYEGNALKKAQEISEMLKLPVIADDSGIEVDALDGRPAVYSARYAGNHDDKANNAKMLQELQGVPLEKRTAKFVTCMAVYLPSGEKFTIRGELKGHILTEEKGNNGFAYDTLFKVEGTDRTMAEMDDNTRMKYSHRIKAIQNLINSDFFKKHFN